MLPQSKVEAVTKALKEEYYLKNFPDISNEKLAQAMVISKPSNGSFMYDPAPSPALLYLSTNSILTGLLGLPLLRLMLKGYEQRYGVMNQMLVVPNPFTIDLNIRIYRVISIFVLQPHLAHLSCVR